METAEKEAIILQETFNDQKNIRVEFNIDRFSGRDVAIQIDYEKVSIITVLPFNVLYNYIWSI